MRQTEKDEFGYDLCSHVEFTRGELHNTVIKTMPIKRQFVNFGSGLFIFCWKLAGVSKTFRYEQQQQLDVINSTTSSVSRRYITLYLFVSHKRLTC